MRVHVVGGFLGAGKTTLLRALARHLAERGERVAVITNDQGSALVDTTLLRRDGRIDRRDLDVREISGGCFCCRYDELESALVAAERDGATVALAEAVGSCTDLVATVLAPLAARHPGRFQLAPLAVAVDPLRLEARQRGDLHDDVAYLFRKQLEEADVLLATRADLGGPSTLDAVRALRPEQPVLCVSGVDGTGLAAWMALRDPPRSATLELDYDRYAAAEALLGWCNARARVTSATGVDPAALMRGFLEAMAAAPVAHVKVAGVAPDAGRGALVRKGGEPVVDASGLPASCAEFELLVNARVAVAPAELEALVRAAMARAAGAAQVCWSAFECFSPSRPVPQHRYASRCGADEEASCCAAFYDRDDVRALLGDSWHPGGVELTLAMAERLSLGEGARLLDVACGKGTSLRAVLERYPARGVGLDAQARGESDARLELVRGDAHAVPFADEGFDAVLCECALSTFFDQPGALRELRRVLRPGGRIALSDMAVEGPLPEALRPWVHTGTCLSRAMTFEAYARALEDAGLRVIERWVAETALHELLRRIKRNLVGAALAAASGQLGQGALRVDMRHAREVLREAERAVAQGLVRYVVLVAERPA